MDAKLVPEDFDVLDHIIDAFYPTGPEPTPLITFRRFCGDKLEEDKFPLVGNPYVAISHVWGDVQWHNMDVWGLEVRASMKKLVFLKESLPGLLEGSWFWMDILCIPQRDSEEQE